MNINLVFIIDSIRLDYIRRNIIIYAFFFVEI